ncbi:MAG TPA: hypothetical protein DCR46_06270 [Cytophagales bacterium]|jgi:EamA domain-containing membrane protein RarD|nr:hypothetical protein [Cytophagales bacterium]
MIQRIQSLFLLGVVVVMVSFCFTKIWVKVNEHTDDEIIFTPVSLTYISASKEANQLANINVNETSTVYIVILSGMISLLSILSLFSFKKRVRQMKYGFLNAVFLVILLLLLYFHISEADKILPHPTYGEYKLGFFLPIIALLFNFLANFFIKRDEDAVRSANRIR